MQAVIVFRVSFLGLARSNCTADDEESTRQQCQLQAMMVSRPRPMVYLNSGKLVAGQVQLLQIG